MCSAAPLLVSLLIRPTATYFERPSIMESTILTRDRLIEVRYLMRLLPHLQATMRIACGQAALSRGTPEVPPAISLHHSDGANSLVTISGDDYVWETAYGELRLPLAAEYREYVSFARTIAEES